MKRILKQLATRFVDRKLRPFELQNERQDAMLRSLADSNFRLRAAFKRAQQEPIRLLFVCHMPSLWSMFESLYQAAVADPNFTVAALALPYRHPTLPEGQYKDDGVYEFLKAKGVNVIRGHNCENSQWVAPASLSADYVFFQTPYDLFPPMWSVDQISLLAKVCYVPYASCLFRGEVDDILHPASFFKRVSFAFIESPFAQKLLKERFKDQDWFDANRIVLSGHPKLDYLSVNRLASGKVWKRALQNNLKRILWTPRWRTAEGNCHFFDYKDFFVEFCRKRNDVDFVFRPHPLCLQNFLRSGELTSSELETLRQTYANSSNMVLDQTGEYQDTFLTSDVLVSDVSSMLLEYFATGKPVIYTHRVDTFNDFGRKLAEGFYWVRNAAELESTLTMILSGKDPLLEKRQELMTTHLFLPNDGAGEAIKNTLRSDYEMLPISEINTQTI